MGGGGGKKKKQHTLREGERKQGDHGKDEGVKGSPTNRKLAFYRTKERKGNVK